MMTLEQIKEAIDRLSIEELEELKDYINHYPYSSTPFLSIEERIRLLDEAARAIYANFTEAEWTQIEKDMNKI